MLEHSERLTWSIMFMAVGAKARLGVFRRTLNLGLRMDDFALDINAPR